MTNDELRLTIDDCGAALRQAALLSIADVNQHGIDD
jgi:hypothetical protein